MPAPLAEAIQHRFPDPISIVLGGALEDGGAKPWDLAYDHCRFIVHRFEPNVDASPSQHFYPFALWDKTETITLRINRLAGATSHFPHNLALAHRFSEFPHIEEPEKVVEVPAIRGDEWMRKHNITDIDFMYLNIEGAELKALNGFGKELDRIIGIHLEMTMIDNYWIGAPCFSDIDPVLRVAGFTFINFTESYRVGRKSAGFRVYNTGQQFQVKALYLRDPVVQTLKPRKLLKLACMADLYGQPELAVEAARIYGPETAGIIERIHPTS